MVELNPTALLLAVAAGYLAIQSSHYLMYRSTFQEWERVIFESTLGGLVLFAVARGLILLAGDCPVAQNMRDWLKAVLPFQSSGTLVSGLLLGIVAGRVHSFVDGRERALHRAVTGLGGDLYRLLLDSGESGQLVSLTMQNGKVYVGLVEGSPSLTAKFRFVTLIPVVSGYRDQSTKTLKLTTSYSRIYADLEALTAAESGLTRNTFGMVFPLDQIVSANRFDMDAYRRYFAGSEV